MNWSWRCVAMVAGGLGVAGVASSVVPVTAQMRGPARVPSNAVAAAPHRAMLTSHCVTCHNTTRRTAGLALDAPEMSDVALRPDVWEKVLQKVRMGAMPSPGIGRPEKVVTDAMLASRNGDVSSVKLLLEHGADVNAAEQASGQTALLWGVSQRHPDVIGLLIKAGADVVARSKQLKRIVLLCCPTWPGDPEGTVAIDQGGLTPLPFAGLTGGADIARLLVGGGANVDVTAAAGTTALAMAAVRGFTELVSLLLERGANPDAAGGGFTALHAAVLRGDVKMVDVLLAHRAAVNVRLTKGTFLKRGSREYAFDKFLVGATPFLLAARFGDLSIMRRLVDAGADVSMRLEDGRTPLMIAVQGEASGATARVRGTSIVFQDSRHRLRLG